MGTDQSRAPDGGAADRLEAQRKAFGALLARITADRDALITAVQETKQQLNVLTARVEGAPAASPTGAGTGSSAGEPLEEVKGRIEEFRQEQRHAVARALAAAEHATLRADEALRRLEELTASQLASAAPAASQPADGDRIDEMRTWAQQFECAQREATAQSGAAVAQAVARADEADGRLEEMAAAVQRQSELLAGLEERLHETGARQLRRLDALHQLIEQAEAEHRQATAAVETAAQRAMQRADDAVLHLEELIAAQAARAAQAAERTGRADAERQALAAVTQAQGEQLTALAARLDEGQAAHAAPLAALRQLVEQVQRDQRQAVAQLSATGEHALFRAEEACRRIEELTTAAASHGQSDELVALRSATDRLTADLHIERIEPVAAAAPAAHPDDTLAELAQRVGGLEAQLHAWRARAKDMSPAQPVPVVGGADEAARAHRGDVGRRAQAAAAAVRQWLSELRVFQPGRPDGGAPRGVWRAGVRAVCRALLRAVRPRSRARRATAPSPYAASPRPAIAAAGLVVATLGLALAIGWQTAHSQRHGTAQRAAPRPAPEGSGRRPLTFSTRLSVETSFAGVPAVDIVPHH